MSLLLRERGWVVGGRSLLEVQAGRRFRERELAPMRRGRSLEGKTGEEQGL